MLNRDEIVQAVDLQKRSYNLLLWLRTAISKGVIRFDRAHDYMDEGEVATEWIEGHYLNLPSNCRPEREQLPAFSRFFATYLKTSFELVKEPGGLLVSSCGCYCMICSYMTAGSNLKTKKLSRRDKDRARKIKITTVQQLAHEHGVHLDQQRLEKLIDSESLARDVALLAYGQQLIARTRGVSHGPAVLALWREIAWTKTAPKKNFELAAEDILRAEQAVATALTESKE